MKEIYLSVRISEKSVEEEDFNFLDKKLKSGMNKSDLVRNALKVYRLYSTGELLEEKIKDNIVVNSQPVQSSSNVESELKELKQKLDINSQQLEQKLNLNIDELKECIKREVNDALSGIEISQSENSDNKSFDVDQESEDIANQVLNDAINGYNL